MPGVRCQVVSCKSNFKKTKTVDKSIHYFRFPKRPELRELWINKCGNSGDWDPEQCRICSLHFLPNDFLKDFRAELMGLPRRKQLQPYAVPSLNLQQDETMSANTNLDLLERESSDDITRNCKNNEKSTQCEHEFTCKQHDSYAEVFKRLENTIIALKNENASLKSEIVNQANDIKKYKSEIATLKRNITHKKKQNQKKILQSTRKLLSKCLTQCQIDLLLGKKKKVTWKEEDISNAFTLRYCSKRAYLYLRKQRKYPLPGNKYLVLKQCI